MLVLIIYEMNKTNGANRAASLTDLIGATGISQTTLHRKLAYLKRKGFIEQVGTRYVLSPEGVNELHMLRGARLPILWATGTVGDLRRRNKEALPKNAGCNDEQRTCA